MSWPDVVAATYRDVGTAEVVTITPATGSGARTYADCQVLGRSDRQVKDGASVTIVTSRTVSIPRLTGATAPSEGEFLAPASGGTYTIRAVSPMPGHWQVEAT